MVDNDNNFLLKFCETQDDTKKQITDLQYDLLELRDAHAKLRTTNDKLRRDKERSDRDRDEYKGLVINSKNIF
jgi:mitofilin